MTSKAVPVVYKGGTFRSLLQRYMLDRMQRDPAFRADVEQAIQRRKDAKNTEGE